MAKKERLSPKEEAYCQFYVCLGADTWSNGTKSCMAAQYSPNNEAAAATQSSILLRKSKIRDRISQLHKEYFDKLGITKDSVILSLIDTRNKAKVDRQWVAAATCDKLLGSTMALFAEKHVIENEPDIEKMMTPVEKEGLADAARLFKFRVADVG